MAFNSVGGYKNESTLAEENILLGRTGQACMEDAAKLPAPAKLFDSFWHLGEMALLVGDGGSGKSTLAVQAGDAISKGLAVPNFGTDAPKQKVLYFDFDKNDKVFESRYISPTGEAYKFDENFVRVVIHPTYNEPKNMRSILLRAFENEIKQHEATIVIVDSITGWAAQCYKVPNLLYEIWQQLKSLKTKYNLSMLVVADTRRYNLGKQLKMNRIAEIADIIPVAENIFALGMCHSTEGLRYLLSLKNTITTGYSERRVAVCRQMQQENFTGIELAGVCTELQMIQPPLKGIEAAIVALKDAEPELTLDAIAQKLGTYIMKVKRTLDVHEDLKVLQAFLTI